MTIYLIQTSLDHFCVVDLSDDERDHILTTVMTPEHTPIPTIYWQTFSTHWPHTPCSLMLGLILSFAKKTWSPDDWNSKNLGNLSDYQNLRAGFPILHIPEHNGTRSAIPSQGHSWRSHRNDQPVSIPCWTCQVSRGHCEDMFARC